MVWSPVRRAFPFFCSSPSLFGSSYRDCEFSLQLPSHHLSLPPHCLDVFVKMHPAWEALQWKDGSRYDGQTRERQCDGIGVMRHPNGDRYEGEFSSGQMDGFGVYVWKGGTLYRGQWHKNEMEGCGVRISRQPDGEFLIQEGQFVGDHFLGTFMDCHQPEARRAAAEADNIASRVAHFKKAECYHQMLPMERRQGVNQLRGQNLFQWALQAMGRKNSSFKK